MAQDAKEKVTQWLSSAGFLVMPLEGPLPSNASWGLLVSTPPPVQVRLRLVGLTSGDVIASVGINLSEEHLAEINKMKPEDRMRLSAELIREVLRVCPYARVALQQDLANPTALIAEVLLDGSTLNRQRLVDDCSRLVNVFFAVNAVLWSRFPMVKPRGGQQGSEIFM